MTLLLPDHLPPERHLGGPAAWLRAVVLGSIDSLISTASLVVAVAAAPVAIPLLSLTQLPPAPTHLAIEGD